MIDVLYVTVGDPNLRSCENNGYYIGCALAEAGLNVEKRQLAHVSPSEILRYGPLKMAYRLVGKDYKATIASGIRKRQVGILEQTALELEARLVFANAPTSVAGLRGRVPYVMYCDAPYAGLDDMGYYLSDWPGWALRTALEMDKEAVLGAESVYFHSTWAADRAASAYGADRAKIEVVPPGANIEFVPREDANLTKPRTETCRLLFFGRAWERKGGPIAVQIHQLLLASGIESELLICGISQLPADIDDVPKVTIVNPIRKDSPTDRQRMVELFRSVDYLLLPTRADTSTSAIRESCAFGVPAISTTVGGLGDLVKDGEEAILLDVSASPEEYIPRILANYTNEAERLRLRCASREAYEQRMLWSTAINTIVADLRARNLL
jgi:glycosyltransferase involved in cell wall biosynthesis